MPTVYHYTNKAGHDAIRRTRYIAKSRVEVRDAVYGDGKLSYCFSIIKNYLGSSQIRSDIS